MNFLNLFNNKKKVYKHIFFDLDRTLWDFEQNMRITLEEIYEKYNLGSNFPSFNIFIETFNSHNHRLWEEYRKGDLKKEILRWKRFELTLKDFGLSSKDLAEKIGEEYVNESPKKTALIPHTIEILEYLFEKKYQLHIITNGFNEVQFTNFGMDQIFFNPESIPHNEKVTHQIKSLIELKEIL